jgi:hypothetical protein
MDADLARMDGFFGYDPRVVDSDRNVYRRFEDERSIVELFSQAASLGVLLPDIVLPIALMDLPFPKSGQ